jgi:hypothetical protein
LVCEQDYSITFSTYFNVEWVEKRLTIMPQWAAEMGLDNSSGNRHCFVLTLIS